MGNKTALFDTHQAMGGKIVDFGGWDMPLHYGSQIDEHHRVRQHAGMFDVSHMTLIDVTGRDAKTYLQYLLANDVDKLDNLFGKALYSGMLNPQGGVIDDLIVYNLGLDGEQYHYRVIVNCGTRDKDLAWMTQVAAAYQVQLQERTDLAMIAVQGPQAITISKTLVSTAAATLIDTLQVFQGLPIKQQAEQQQQEWFFARTGYTGEDGLEIILPNEQAPAFWQALATAGVAPCGLGARDTLRLEAGMNLYGHEMDDNTSPLAANMGWTIAWQPQDRDFIGRAPLAAEKAAGLRHKLVGLVLRERGVLRAEQLVHIANSDERGIITSGTFSPSLGYSIALARIPLGQQPLQPGDQCQVEMRGKLVTVEVVAPSFVRQGKALV